MQQIEAGVMLCQIREQKRVSQKKLSNGICSTRALSRYESGERMPDGLSFHCLMQRVGMNPRDFTVMLSLQEYRYYMWKESVLDAIQKKDWNSVKDSMENEVNLPKGCGGRMQRQFRLYLQSIVEEKLENDGEKAWRLLGEAIGVTASDCFRGELAGYWLSIFEIGLLALYYYKGGERNLIHSKEVCSRLKYLIAYTEEIITDKEECAKLVPGMVCALLRICGDQMGIMERLSYEEKAVLLLKESGGLYHLPEVLRLYTADLAGTDEEKERVYGKQYSAFKEVLEDAGYDTDFQPELLFDSSRQFYLLNEYLRSHRIMRGMTQLQISEGICAAETYSRVETGKTVPRPKERKAFFERLNIGFGYFRGELETTDYELFHYLALFKEAARKEEWVKAAGWMERIRDRLDTESINNRQYIGMMENWVAFAAKQIDAEEFYRRDEELLRLSVKEELLEKTELYYFTYIEIVLYSHLANILKIQGRQREGIELLKKMLGKIEKSKADLEYWWWDSMKVPIFNLANMLSDLGDYEESLKYMTDFTQKCFRLFDGKFAGYGIGEQALDMEQLHTANKTACDRMLVQVFYMTDFYNMTKDHNQLKKHYEKHYEADKEWY